MAVKQVCCDRLLAARVEQKLAGRRAGEILNRLHVAQPDKRDNAARPANVPSTVDQSRAQRAAGEVMKTEKHLQVRRRRCKLASSTLT